MTWQFGGCNFPSMKVAVSSHPSSSNILLRVSEYVLGNRNYPLLSSSGGFRICLRKKSKYRFWNINPHTQHFLWRRIFLGYPYSRAPGQWMHFSEFLLLSVTSILFLFSRRVTLIRNGTTIPHFIAFSFLMTFAQPSISDMFQARNIADLTAEAAD